MFIIVNNNMKYFVPRQQFKGNHCCTFMLKLNTFIMLTGTSISTAINKTGNVHIT